MKNSNTRSFVQPKVSEQREREIEKGKKRRNPRKTWKRLVCSYRLSRDGSVEASEPWNFWNARKLRASAIGKLEFLSWNTWHWQEKTWNLIANVEQRMNILYPDSMGIKLTPCSHFKNPSWSVRKTGSLRLIKYFNHEDRCRDKHWSRVK